MTKNMIYFIPKRLYIQEEKIMHRRITALLLILLLLFGVFACKGPDVQPDGEATPMPQLEDEYFLPKEDGTKQLTIYCEKDSAAHRMAAEKKIRYALVK